jgi:hypothetical protein
MLATLLSSERRVVPFYLDRYKKGGPSKIKIVCQKTEELPLASRSTYVLCDSWYTCESVIKPLSTEAIILLAD